MPTYPFFCRDCRKPFEVVKPVGAKTAQCPHCKGKNTERIWSTVSVKTSKKS
jgi:putative FmdB family regulatory protein